MDRKRIGASFRDLSGYVFEQDGEIFRQINPIYEENYQLLMNSGLYQNLVDNGLLILHFEMENNVIKPEKVFISYPYEWSFSQYKDAALATLEIQNISLEYGMSLKDASAYNIQFHKGKPVLIDTLSFEKYEEGSPWIAYKQFCQHFLAPLALMSKDLRLSSLMKNYIDGIPLDLTSNLLPNSTKFNFGILSHIHLHSKTQIKYQSSQESFKNKVFMSKFQLKALIDSLNSCVKSLKPKVQDTEWEKYYTFTNYDDKSFEEKKNIVSEFIEEASPKTVWDLGGNTGIFSRIASDKCIDTVSFDIDPLAIEKSYLDAKSNNEANILPLIMDLTNPSPSIGWANEERENLLERSKGVDLIMALALIHHLAISNNLPFEKIAKYFSKLSKYLIIEFVEKEDSQVQKLLATREDIFDKYDVENFEKSFGEFYSIKAKKQIDGTKRIMYLMETVNE